MNVKALIIAAATLLSVNAAWAQNPTREMAKRHYDNGAAYYSQADYKAAIDEFQKAYKLNRAPELLHNLGRCHEALGELDRAIELFEQYLRERPKAPNRVTLELRIKNLRKRLKPAPKPPATPATAPAPKPREVPVIPPPVTPQARTSPMKIAGWAAVGLGAAGLVAAGVLGGLASKETGEYEDAWSDGLPASEGKQILERAEGYEVGMFVALGVGGAAAIAGVVLLLMDRNKEAPGDVALGLGGATLRPTAGGLAVAF